MLASLDSIWEPWKPVACLRSTSAEAEDSTLDTLWGSISATVRDRKSTRLNSSHGYISYAVFCLKKKNDDVREPPGIEKFVPIIHSMEVAAKCRGSFACMEVQTKSGFSLKSTLEATLLNPASDEL